MLSARRIKNQQPTPYATGSDFCRIFERDMDRLYLLSFLLTGDHSTAEKCFVSSLENSKKGNPVFREWAESWARRVIIKSAVQMIRPRPADRSKSVSVPQRSASRSTPAPAEIAKIVELPAFERFAFVMSVLERYTDQECALFLECTRGEVTAARVRGLRQIGKSAQLQRIPVSAGSGEQLLRNDPGTALRLQALSPAAACA